MCTLFVATAFFANHIGYCAINISSSTFVLKTAAGLLAGLGLPGLPACPDLIIIIQCCVMLYNTYRDGRRVSISITV